MIEVQGLYDAYKVRPAAGKTGARPFTINGVKATAACQPGGDIIQISPEAALRAELDVSGKARAANSEMTAERMTYLKSKYRGDACPVSPREVAGAMIDRVRGTIG